MYTGRAPPAAPAVGNNRRPLPAIGGRFGLRPVSSYTSVTVSRQNQNIIGIKTYLHWRTRVAVIEWPRFECVQPIFKEMQSHIAVHFDEVIGGT